MDTQLRLRLLVGKVVALMGIFGVILFQATGAVQARPGPEAPAAASITVFDSYSFPIEPSTPLRATINQPKTFYVAVSDFDGAPENLQFSVVSSNQAVVPTNNINSSISYSSASYISYVVQITPIGSGSTDFTFTVIDSTMVQAQHSLIVVETNSTPVISAIPNQTGEVGVPIVLDFTASDADGDFLQLNAFTNRPEVIDFAIDGSAPNFTITITPIADFANSAIVTIDAFDGIDLGTEEIVVTLAQTSEWRVYVPVVMKSQQAPVISMIADQTVNEGQTLAIPFTITDPENNPFTIGTSVSPPEIATVVVNGGNGSYTLDITGLAPGTAMVTITANDGIATSTRSFGLTVTSAVPNTPPTLVDSRGNPLRSAIRAVVNGTRNQTVFIADPDSDVMALGLTVTSSDQSVLADSAIEITNGTYDGAERGVFYVNATPANPGTTTLTFTATDGEGGQSTHTMTMTVVASNTAPVIAEIPNQTTSLNTPITVPFTVTDAENDPITFEYNISSQIATVDIQHVSGNNYTATITPTATGTASVVIIANDGIEVGSDSFTLTVE